MKKHLGHILAIACFTLIATNLLAQSSDKNFKAVDDYVQNLGKLDTLNMGSITIAVTQHFSDKMDKVRAIFDWIAFNIELDCKAVRSNNIDKQSSDDVLKSRKGTSSGYATLFQDMCSVAGIRCLTVDGYIKNSTEDINTKPDEINHTWDVVQLGQSQEEWHYIDAALGSGYTDKSIKIFTKSFNDNYFFADKTTFNLQCFPDNTAWQLDKSGPKTEKDFFSMPVLKSTAFPFGITGFTPLEGNTKIKTGKPVRFSIATRDPDSVNVVSIRIGDEKKSIVKQVSYSLSGGNIIFSYTFDASDTYPIAILINGKEVLDYLVEVDD